MIDKKSWKEFRDSKMMWVANRALQLFGWSIVCEFKGGEIVSVFPARVKYRGFDEKTDSEGFVGVSKFMEENAKMLKQESEL